MTLQKRFAFDCPGCECTFHRTLAAQAKPQLLLECPYCSTEYQIDFDPERSTVLSISKSKDKSKS